MNIKERIKKILSPNFKDKFVELYKNDPKVMNDMHKVMHDMHKAYIDGLRESMGLDETWHHYTCEINLNTFMQLQKMLGEDMQVSVMTVRDQLVHSTIFVSKEGINKLKEFIGD